MKGHPGFHTTIYEDDVNDVSRPDPRIKGIRVVGFKGTTFRAPVNPGKRPRRKKGESPLQ
jgi:hypothetical protein